jgi:hypothetical protein
MNRQLLENLVRHFEGSSAIPAEARLNNLTANLRFLLKYGDQLPDFVMSEPTITVGGKAIIAQERQLQAKVYLDQQDVTGSFLNPDNLFEAAFQEILFIVKSAKQQSLQYIPYIPLYIVVDKEPGTLRPCLTFKTRFGIMDAPVVVQPAPVIVVKEKVVEYTGSTTDSAPALSDSRSNLVATAPPVYNTDNTVHHNVRDDQYLHELHQYEKVHGRPVVVEPVNPADSLPVAPVVRTTGVTPLQAAIADSPEELNELPFISDHVAPTPSTAEVRALYDPSAVVMPERKVVVESVEETKPQRKGGWPKGKPRPKKGEPGYAGR